jgi:hypothetical protein
VSKRDTEKGLADFERRRLMLTTNRIRAPEIRRFEKGLESLIEPGRPVAGCM